MSTSLLRTIGPSMLTLLLSWATISCSNDLCSGDGVPTIAKVSLKYKDQPWYRCFINSKGHRMFITTTRVHWTFQHELGYWAAYGNPNKKLYMTARGKNFTIEPGYVWDGATEGPTTAKLLTPTLFHDAMLHALMNGAPINQEQADGAFYQLLKAEDFYLADTYHFAVSKFGDQFLTRQNPPTLIIKNLPNTKKSSKP